MSSCELRRVKAAKEVEDAGNKYGDMGGLTQESVKYVMIGSTS